MSISLSSSTVSTVLSSTATLSAVFGFKRQPTNTNAMSRSSASGIRKYHLAFLRFLTLSTLSPVFCGCSLEGSKRMSASSAVNSEESAPPARAALSAAIPPESGSPEPSPAAAAAAPAALSAESGSAALLCAAPSAASPEAAPSAAPPEAVPAPSAAKSPVFVGAICPSKLSKRSVLICSSP